MAHSLPSFMPLENFRMGQKRQGILTILVCKGLALWGFQEPLSLDQSNFKHLQADEEAELMYNVS